MSFPTLLCFLGLCLPTLLSAQFLDIGGFGGVVTFNGDVHQGGFLPNTQAAFGGFVRYHFHPHFAAKINFVKGTLKARDRDAIHLHIRERNLSFKSDLMEFALIGEVNITPFVPDKSSKVFAPYIFAGVGLIVFNPKTSYQGEWVELQKVGTEGQGLEGFSKPYSLMSVSIPLGIGLKYAISKRINIGLDIGYRFTLTDYLDDVSTVYVSPKTLADNSQLAVALSNRTEEYTGLPANDRIGQRRGNSNNNDGYLLWGVTVSFNLHGKKTYKKKTKKRPYMLNKWI